MTLKYVLAMTDSGYFSAYRLNFIVLVIELGMPRRLLGLHDENHATSRHS